MEQGDGNGGANRPALEDILLWGALVIDAEKRLPTEEDLLNMEAPAFTIDDINAEWGSWDNFANEAYDTFVHTQDSTQISQSPFLENNDTAQYSEESDEPAAEQTSAENLTEKSGMFNLLVPGAEEANADLERDDDGDMFSVASIAQPAQPTSGSTEPTKPFGLIVDPSRVSAETLTLAREQGAVEMPIETQEIDDPDKNYVSKKKTDLGIPVPQEALAMNRAEGRIAASQDTAKALAEAERARGQTLRNVPVPTPEELQQKIAEGRAGDTELYDEMSQGQTTLRGQPEAPGPGKVKEAPSSMITAIAEALAEKELENQEERKKETLQGIPSSEIAEETSAPIRLSTEDLEEITDGGSFVSEDYDAVSARSEFSRREDTTIPVTRQHSIDFARTVRRLGEIEDGILDDEAGVTPTPGVPDFNDANTVEFDYNTFEPTSDELSEAEAAVRDAIAGVNEDIPTPAPTRPNRDIDAEYQSKKPTIMGIGMPNIRQAEDDGVVGESIDDSVSDEIYDLGRLPTETDDVVSDQAQDIGRLPTENDYSSETPDDIDSPDSYDNDPVIPEDIYVSESKLNTDLLEEHDVPEDPILPEDLMPPKDELETRLLEGLAGMESSSASMTAAKVIAKGMDFDDEMRERYMLSVIEECELRDRWDEIDDVADFQHGKYSQIAKASDNDLKNGEKKFSVTDAAAIAAASVVINTEAGEETHEEPTPLPAPMPVEPEDSGRYNIAVGAGAIATGAASTETAASIFDEDSLESNDEDPTQTYTESPAAGTPESSSGDLPDPVRSRRWKDEYAPKPISIDDKLADAPKNKEESAPMGYWARRKLRKEEDKKLREERKAKAALAKQKAKPVSTSSGRKSRLAAYVLGGALAIGGLIGGGVALNNHYNNGQDSRRQAVAEMYDASTSNVASSDADLEQRVVTASDRDAGVTAAVAPTTTPDAGQAIVAVGSQPDAASNAGGADTLQDTLNLQMHYDSINYSNSGARETLRAWLVNMNAQGIHNITIYTHRSQEDKDDLRRVGHPDLNKGIYNTGLAGRGGTAALGDAQNIVDEEGLGIIFTVVNLSEVDMYATGLDEASLAKNRGVTFRVSNAPNPELNPASVAGCVDAIPCGSAVSSENGSDGRTGSITPNGDGTMTADNSTVDNTMNPDADGDILIDDSDMIPIYATAPVTESSPGNSGPENDGGEDFDIPIFVEVRLADKYGICIYADLSIDEIISKNGFAFENGEVVAVEENQASAYDSQVAKDCLSIASTITDEFRHTLFGQAYGNALSKENFGAEFMAKYGMDCSASVASEVYTLMATHTGTELVDGLKGLFVENGLMEDPKVIELDYADFELIEDEEEVMELTEADIVEDLNKTEDDNLIYMLGDDDIEIIEDEPIAYAKSMPPPSPGAAYSNRQVKEASAEDFAAVDLILDEILDGYNSNNAPASEGGISDEDAYEFMSIVEESDEEFSKLASAQVGEVIELKSYLAKPENNPKPPYESPGQKAVNNILAYVLDDAA